MFVEYIWIDGTEPTRTLRSKTKVLPNLEMNNGDIPTAADLPNWGFDGSSTAQATGETSDCVLKPVCVVADPVRGGKEGGNYLALCEVFMADRVTPHPSNTRALVRGFLSEVFAYDDAWFGFEQEYTLFAGSSPLGFGPDRRCPPPQGPYYCGVGADEVYGREMVEEHMKACYDAGLKLSGINAEVMPGQWEFQIGPGNALEASDHLWIARWLLYRIGEEYNITATLDAKPIPGDWNGAGMHSNFSTASMRQEGGMEHIEAWCKAAGDAERIQAHLAAYGDGIEARLTGKHETCSYLQFAWGVSDRTASIRIPLDTATSGYGYLEDRRPNANACPYEVAMQMLRTAQIADSHSLAEEVSSQIQEEVSSQIQ